MKQIVLVQLMILGMFAQAEGLPLLSDLASLEWESRVIVVNEMNDESEALALLEGHEAEIDDRHIIWFILKEDLAISNYPGRLAQEFLSNTRARLGPRYDKVILIGKDGGIKSRSNHLDLEAIFSEIDAMPMRQYEMQN